jgi:multisite-specific tRNA:(cytosine-C5)-methyltransferase
MRLLPHDQDTGGFFVCVLQKSSTAQTTSTPSIPLPEVDTSEPITIADESGSTSTTLKRALSPQTEEREGKKVDMGENKVQEEKVEAGAEEGKEEVEVEVEKSKAKGKPQGKGKEKKVKRDLSFKEEAFGFVDPTRPEVKSIV